MLGRRSQKYHPRRKLARNRFFRSNIFPVEALYFSGFKKRQVGHPEPKTSDEVQPQWTKKKLAESHSIHLLASNQMKILGMALLFLSMKGQGFSGNMRIPLAGDRW